MASDHGTLAQLVHCQGTELERKIEMRASFVMSSARLGIIVLVVASLTSCGRSPGERAVSGGLIGAGGGALLSGAAGVSPLAGAAIGGTAGAIGGALTARRH